LGANLSYDPITGILTLKGVLTKEQRDFLLNPYVQKTDFYGNRVYDEHGNPETVSATFTKDSNAIKALFTDSQDVPPSQGYGGIQIGGPGTYYLKARNMDLAVTEGIRSIGPQSNPNLIKISTLGADLSIHLDQDLTMTSSRIVSLNGG